MATILIDGEFSEADDMVVGKTYLRGFVWDGSKLVSGLVDSPPPQETGEPVAPAQAWPKGVRLLNDFGLANTVTPATITGMVLELPAGAWVVQYMAIHVDTNDQIGHGTRLHFGGPTCYSFTSGFHGNHGATGDPAKKNMLAFPQGVAAGGFALSQTSEQVTSGTGVQSGGSFITTLIVAEVPITLSLQIGQLSNMTNTTTTVKAGTWMSAMPLNAITGATSILAANLGGTGIANPVEATETIVGAFPRTLRLSGPTDLTLPTSGTLARLTDIPAPTPAGVTQAQMDTAIANAITALKADPSTFYALVEATGLPVENAQIPGGNTITVQSGLVIRPG